MINATENEDFNTTVLPDMKGTACHTRPHEACHTQESGSRERGSGRNWDYAFMTILVGSN